MFNPINWNTNSITDRLLNVIDGWHQLSQHLWQYFCESNDKMSQTIDTLIGTKPVITVKKFEEIRYYKSIWEIGSFLKSLLKIGLSKIPGLRFIFRWSREEWENKLLSKFYFSLKPQNFRIKTTFLRNTPSSPPRFGHLIRSVAYQRKGNHPINRFENQGISRGNIQGWLISTTLSTLV